MMQQALSTAKQFFFFAVHEQTIVRIQLFEVTKINHIS